MAQTAEISSLYSKEQTWQELRRLPVTNLIPVPSRPVPSRPDPTRPDQHDHHVHQDYHDQHDHHDHHDHHDRGDHEEVGSHMRKLDVVHNEVGGYLVRCAGSLALMDNH